MMQLNSSPLAMLASIAMAGPALVASPVDAAAAPVPKIAAGTFDARMTVPGKKTVYHRIWRLSPSCLGARCAQIRLRMQRSDGRFDTVTLRRDQSVYRGKVRTRSLCRGKLATRGGTISVALTVTQTVARDMVSGHETIISGVGGELRVRSPAGVCPRRRHLGSRVRVGADRTDLPDAPMVDFHVLTEGPSVSARTNTVQFSDISTPPDDVVTRTWDFGDPSSGTANRGSGAAVTHTYALPGSYRVSLTVADRFGQVASGSGSVDVLP